MEQNMENEMDVYIYIYIYVYIGLYKGRMNYKGGSYGGFSRALLYGFLRGMLGV